MKEMLSNFINQGDIRMKKTLLIAVLAMALVMAFGASPAFAKYAGYNSQKQYLTWSEVNSLASLNADAALMARGPHSGYATTTIKCAVCHSVHRAGGKLLNEGTTCAYCHSPASEGGAAVATGKIISWYSTPNSLGKSQSPHSSCSTSYCHGGPHGVGASVYAGPATRLMNVAADTKLEADVAANGLTTAVLATWDGNAQTRALSTGATCSRSTCHDESMFGVVTAGAMGPSGIAGDTSAGLQGKLVTGHRVIAAATADWNKDSSFPTTKTGFQIAYKPVDYCNSCHDLKDDNNGGNAAFPHGLQGIVSSAQGADGNSKPAVWLTAAANAGAQSTVVGTYNNYVGGSANTSSAAGSPALDGICLKCHVGSNGTTGVGQTY